VGYLKFFLRFLKHKIPIADRNKGNWEQIISLFFTRWYYHLIALTLTQNIVVMIFYISQLSFSRRNSTLINVFMVVDLVRHKFRNVAFPSITRARAMRYGDVIQRLW